MGNSYCFFTFLSIQNPSVEKQKKSISFHFGGGGGVHSSKLVVKGCVFTFHRRTEEPVQEIQEPHIFSGPDFFFKRLQLREAKNMRLLPAPALKP